MSSNGFGGSLEDLNKMLNSGSNCSGLARKSQNMTECVPVPTSEHVAEIVGRQGKKSQLHFFIRAFDRYLINWATTICVILIQRNICFIEITMTFRWPNKNEYLAYNAK